MSVANLCGVCGQWPQNCTCERVAEFPKPAAEWIIDLANALANHPADCVCQRCNGGREVFLLASDVEAIQADAIAEWQAHEKQTHELLGAILGRDDSLEQKAKQLREKYDELREFVRLITLQLQKSRSLTHAQFDELFQYGYRMYVKHDVEKYGRYVKSEVEK